ncbi:hypothetical protein HOY82DRAFT_595833 [Tuber indicum]|nr:hypothetical protein HOY82DRAFT_595833 [Tuber indicum]
MPAFREGFYKDYCSAIATIVACVAGVVTMITLARLGLPHTVVVVTGISVLKRPVRLALTSDETDATSQDHALDGRPAGPCRYLAYMIYSEYDWRPGHHRPERPSSGWTDAVPCRPYRPCPGRPGSPNRSGPAGRPGRLGTLTGIPTLSLAGTPTIVMAGNPSLGLGAMLPLPLATITITTIAMIVARSTPINTIRVTDTLTITRTHTTTTTTTTTTTATTTTMTTPVRADRVVGWIRCLVLKNCFCYVDDKERVNG